MRTPSVKDYVAAWARMREALAELQAAIDQVRDLPPEGYRPARKAHARLSPEELADAHEADANNWEALQADTQALGWTARMVEEAMQGMEVPPLSTARL